jgi:hypothetical protein
VIKEARIKCLASHDIISLVFTTGKDKVSMARAECAPGIQCPALFNKAGDGIVGEAAPGMSFQALLTHRYRNAIFGLVFYKIGPPARYNPQLKHVVVSPVVL